MSKMSGIEFQTHPKSLSTAMSDSMESPVPDAAAAATAATAAAADVDEVLGSTEPRDAAGRKNEIDDMFGRSGMRKRILVEKERKKK